MLIFAKFVMRDSGLPIHINTPHVTQVRLTLDGEPGREHDQDRKRVV